MLPAAPLRSRVSTTAVIALGLTLISGGCMAKTPSSTAIGSPTYAPSTDQRVAPPGGPAPRVSASDSPLATSSPSATGVGNVSVWATGRRPADAADIVATAIADLLAMHPTAISIGIEGIDEPGRGASVVTAWVWLADQAPQRWAVGVVTDTDGVHPSGSRWRLPTVTTAPVALTLEPVTDEHSLNQAAAALTSNGYDVSGLALTASVDSWPLVASFLDAGRFVTVWLRRHLDHLVVAGTAGVTPGTGANS